VLSADGTGNNLVPVGTLYTWGAPVVTGGLTGGAAERANYVRHPLILRMWHRQPYAVTPASGRRSLSIAPFTVTVTINPKPCRCVLRRQCSTAAAPFLPDSAPAALTTIVPAGTTYATPVVTSGITDGQQG